MDFNKQKFLPSILQLLTVFLLVLSSAAYCQSSNGQPESKQEQDLTSALAALDEAYQDKANQYFKRLAKSPSIQTLNLENIDTKVAQEIGVEGNLPTKAIAQTLAIRQQLKPLLDDLEPQKIKPILALLYEVNDTATVQSITEVINKRGSPALRSYNYYLQAQYYYQRKHWRGAIAALNRVNRKELEPSESQYADLLNGYVLQAQKQHRKAVNFFQLIPEQSPYYHYAKLNQGLAYLRQGWWSEAHREFDQARNSLAAQQEPDFKNRLLLVLAYSQIHNEFYRDARKTLRNITLDSRYIQKALIGLGLSAAYQEDYAGALNAFARVTNGDRTDVNRDEAFLLVPAVYKEMGNSSKALEAFEAAKTYYLERLAFLAKTKQTLLAKSQKNIPQLLRSLGDQAEQLYGEQDFIPSYMVQNYFLLRAMDDFAQAQNTQSELAELELRYEQSLKALVIQNIELREALLQQYLSQARYGVAQLYDNP